MFWGLIMEPNKRYSQTVASAFHLSMASLDAQVSGDDLVQVMMSYENRTYLLCSLQSGSIYQVPLDLNFQEGTEISFVCNGKGHVHLTGYLIPDDGGYDDLEDLEDEDEEDEEDEGIPDLVEMKKRKGSQNKKEQQVSKKSKTDLKEDDDSDSDSDDEDESFGMENESDEEDESDDDESDEDEEDEEEEEKPVKPVKQKQNQQIQQNNKKINENNQNQMRKEKEKLVNGKEQKADKEKIQKKKNEAKNPEKAEQQQPKKRIVEGGIQVEDIREGNGPVAKSGKFVTVYYTGKLKNGKKFDQTTQGEGFKFRLGKSEVIRGWDIGIAGMKVGGKRRIVIPPQMGYGAKGSPPVIPPNSQLHFDVELRGVH